MRLLVDTIQLHQSAVAFDRFLCLPKSRLGKSDRIQQAIISDFVLGPALQDIESCARLYKAQS